VAKRKKWQLQWRNESRKSAGISAPASIGGMTIMRTLQSAKSCCRRNKRFAAAALAAARKRYQRHLATTAAAIWHRHRAPQRYALKLAALALSAGAQAA